MIKVGMVVAHEPYFPIGTVGPRRLLGYFRVCRVNRGGKTLGIEVRDSVTGKVNYKTVFLWEVREQTEKEVGDSPIATEGKRGPVKKERAA